MSDELVKIQKDDVIISVSPLVVEDHQGLGWTIVTETEAAPAEAEPSASQDDKPVRGKSSKKS